MGIWILLCGTAADWVAPLAASTTSIWVVVQLLGLSHGCSTMDGGARYFVSSSRQSPTLLDSISPQDTRTDSDWPRHHQVGKPAKISE